MGVTPKEPVVLNDDGTVDILIYQGRTQRVSLTHAGLADCTGYKCRAEFAANFRTDPFLELSTEAATENGSLITLNDLTVGTRIDIFISDEDADEIVKGNGVWDVVLESPGGEESPVIPSSKWTLHKKVSS